MSQTRLQVGWLLVAFGVLFPCWLEARERPEAVTVVMWNLLSFFNAETADTFATNEKPAETRKLAAQILAELKPDILAVLEIGPGAEIQELQSALRNSGLDLPYSILAGGADPLRRTALLSRFPLLENHSRSHVTFELGGRHLAMQRGILDVAMDLPGIGAVRCIGVHLKSKRETPEFDETEFRDRELRELTKHVNDLLEAAEGAKILLWGDFNSTKQEPSMRRLAGVRASPGQLHRAELADARGDRWTHHWEEADLYSRIDFFFLSRALQPFVNKQDSVIATPPDWSRVSDHRPLKLVLQVP